jgi:hypothetical protein
MSFSVKVNGQPYPATSQHGGTPTKAATLMTVKEASLLTKPKKNSTPYNSATPGIVMLDDNTLKTYNMYQKAKIQYIQARNSAMRENTKK